MRWYAQCVECVDTDRQHMVGGLFYELVMVSECLENKKRIVNTYFLLH